MNRIDKNKNPSSKTDVYAFGRVRNEILRLPFFLEYHRKIGVDRFFMVDNDSNDGSTEYLLEQPDVYLFHTSESYAKSQSGVKWMNTLFSQYADGHWTLVLDIDELFVFPYCEQIDLKKLIEYLQSKSEESMVGFLLDMYSKKPLNQVTYQPKSSFLTSCDYFDTDSFTKFSGNVPARGGVRDRVFWNKYEGSTRSPFLIKVPLVKWRTNLFWESSHSISNVRTSNISSALLHFKFFSDFHNHVMQETRRKEHWDNASQYAVYLDALEQNPNLSLYYENSMKYKNSRTLVKLGWVNAPKNFLEFIEQQKITSNQQ